MALILITGTSSGFGRDLVKALLPRGHKIIATMRGDQSKFDALYSEELKLFRGNLFFRELHLDRPESYETFAKEISQDFEEKLDVIINNAGYGLMGPLEDMSETQIRKQMEVNFFGPILLTKAFLPTLRRTRGRIINISSVCGQSVFPLYGMYCASKHALEAATEALYFDLARWGIQCSLVEPGGYQTNFATSSLIISEASHSPQSPYFERMKNFIHRKDRYTKNLPDAAPVIRKTVALCENQKIPLRVPVGATAWALWFVRRFFPDQWRVSFLETLFRRILKI